MSSNDYIDNEAEESEEEYAGSNQDEDDDDDGAEDDKLSGFVTDKDETSHDDSESDSGTTGKKRYHDEDDIDDDLDEDDFDLINENTGIDLQRNKRFRRVRTLESAFDEEPEDDIMALPPEADPVVAKKPSTSEKPSAPHDDIFAEMSSDEDDDFIVDEEGRPIHEEDDEADEAMHDANDIFRIDFDYLDEGADEVEEYEEDDYLDEDIDSQDESEPRRRSRKKVSKKGRSLFEIYEPTDLEKRYLSKRDEKIRITDMPERHQLRKIAVTKADDTELDNESQWIYSQAFMNPSISNQGINYGSGSQLMITVREILALIRNEGLEIPFIAHYRKEIYRHSLQVDDLWRIYNWDIKWMYFSRRKQNMAKLFAKVQQYQYDKAKNTHDFSTFNAKIIDAEDTARLEECNTYEELQDVYTHFLLYHHKELEDLRNDASKKTTNSDDKNQSDNNEKRSGESIRRLRRRNFYTRCEDNKISHLALKFGLSPERFGKNVIESYQINEPTQYEIDPNTTARDYITKAFPTVEAVLDAAVYTVAVQLSRDPLVRRAVRLAFYERAKISCRPTKRGKKAEKEGFITHTFSVEPSASSWGSYADELKQYYFVDGFSDLIKEWNELRGRAVQKAVEDVLFEEFRKELQEKLLRESYEYVIKECCCNVRKRINVASFKIGSENDEDDEMEPYQRIMSFAFVSDRDIASYACVIDGHGEIKEIKLIKGLIVSKQPVAIAISASCRQATGVKKDLEGIVNELQSEEDLPPISVELIDPCIPRLFESSKRAKNEFPEYPPLLCHAISLARYMQEPLLELSQLLTSDDEEILCLRLHILQAEIPKPDLMEALYIEFINCINDIGIDLNLCLTNERYSSLLSFVCGLGPRKATALLKLLKKGNLRLRNRKSLVTECGMGPNLFVNCAGFIKIPTNKVDDSDYAEILDTTRIHPEAYDWARKMAIDALDYDESAEEINQATVVHDIIDQPDKLKDLDLDAFAEELKRQGFGNKSVTLYDIREELTHRYKECRQPFDSLSPGEVFYLLVDETPESLCYGQLITCRVIGIVHRRPTKDQIDRVNPERDPISNTWTCPLCLFDSFKELSEVWRHIDNNECKGIAIGVKVILDSGITGFISTKNISDKQIRTPEERVKIGMVIHCRIIKLNIDKLSVDLSCKSSDLADHDNQFSKPKDNYYDTEIEKADMEEDVKKTKKQQIPYIKRIIVHPSFHNISYKDAVEKLSHLDNGDAVFRPSRKGSDHLTLTWKVLDDIYQHVDIREEGKVNSFSLGHSLRIGNEEYEDLDEILARYVQPMAALTRDIINHRYYYVAGDTEKKELEKLLLSEKKKQPSRIPYHFSASSKYPGKFMLSYLPRNHPCYEYVTVTPEGFRFRGRLHAKLDALLHWFKRHFRDPMPGTSRGTSVSQDTPMNAVPPNVMQAVNNLTNISQSQLMSTLQSIQQKDDWLSNNNVPTYANYGYQQLSTGNSEPQKINQWENNWSSTWSAPKPAENLNKDYNDNHDRRWETPQSQQSDQKRDSQRQYDRRNRGHRDDRYRSYHSRRN
ncbi:uncharacterized protein TRIADDRAFT_59208 [Trichoplax adhaerens]|uniref:Suppressor of Ty 6 homolog n=1 Tax=Trichoplax adhaerens TaxID=10228 RepID=B3S561_TRIAD|nr:hypothetical protein TRIADDRAFT_59208 [Trichoplax adhaerens]EDV22209.1 hypothetical protein TRIADDRAFT_59208 [Trichoplax adhaerens]|eukprot:XP_002115364.1 hypothetical protein TRIADDRAFT_59208 [Trichoplax adhaerens]